MNKDEIIRNISRRNEELEQEVKLWQAKYQTIHKAYKQLLNKQKQELIKLKQAKWSPQQTVISNNFMSLTTTESPQKIKQKKQSSPTKSLVNNFTAQSKKEDMFDFFSEDISKSYVVGKKICELIQGCFIIEKIGSIVHFDPVRFLYPQGRFQKLKSMFDIIYRFIFVDDKIEQIMDDQYSSRKNEINFGTPSEDFQFMFDNMSDKSEKGRLSQFQKATHLIRKRYIYGVVRPQLITMNKQSYQTELAYGFISSAPFPNFFKDLNRIVQQQLKFRMLNMNKVIIGKKQKVDIISDIIKDFTSKSLQKSLTITSYPINLQLKANICGLRLVYNNKSNYISDQFNYIEGFIHKFNLLKLIKIFHYVLSEQHIILVCKSRKSLNQLFEIIRIIIYPFNWIFPIIYFYSPFFEPFLSSPMPIIVGYIENSKSTAEEGNNIKATQLPQNEFVTIFAEEEQNCDLNETQSFKARIKKCYKQMGKGKSKDEKNMSHLLQKNLENRLTNKFYSYTKQLRHFIETGQLQQQIDDFHIQFMQTQLAAYYKENKN